jgi:allophanate hydrolase
MGSLKLPQPPLKPDLNTPAAGEIAVAVVGAHLSGLPLNGELQSLGARLLEATTTAPDYKFYALNGTVPPKPGLLRVDAGKGSAIEVEIWALPVEGFGKFVDGIPSPLSIGTIKLSDGRGVKGFLLEAAASNDARDISSFGGWRKYLAQKS